MGVGPVPSDEAAAPAEDGLWRYKEAVPPLTRDETREQSDQRTVGPAEAGAPDLAAEHGQLVAQDEDLGVLRKGVHLIRWTRTSQGSRRRSW